MLDLSVIIVNYNAGDLLEQCLRSVYKDGSGVRFEVFVVDNCSSDGSLELSKENFPQVNFIINEKNLGFAKANNRAISRSRGRYVLLLNPDTILREKVLEKMVFFMEQHPRAGAVGAKLLDPDPEETVQLSCRRFPSHWTALFNRYSL